VTASVAVADLGGSSIRVARIDGDDVVDRREEDTTDDPAQIVRLLRGVAGDAETAVVGVPGRVDHANRRIGYPPNLDPAWAPMLDERALAEAVGLPVSLANDADLAAVGEALHGAGRAYEDVVFITLSTGVGAGVVLGGRLVRGRSSLAEIGHTVLDRHSLETVEMLASGTALGTLGGAPGPEVVARAVAGDAEAGAALTAVLEAAAVAVLNLVHVFSPQVVVVGGGLGRNGDLVLDPIRALVAERGPRGLDVDVVGAALDDDAALVGARSWAAATS
jgi:glucokinase